MWDPLSDTLVSIFKAGASRNVSIDPNGGLLAQFIHGGLSYDDPIETTRVSTRPSTTGSEIGRFYPVYDEAGTGNLDAVLNASGEIVARNVPNDPFGAHELDLNGAAVDGMAIRAAKDRNGHLSSVDVTVRTTEALSAATLAAGLRLAAVDGGGAVVRSSGAVPQLIDNDPYTARFTLTPAQWTALTDASPVGRSRRRRCRSR